MNDFHPIKLETFEEFPYQLVEWKLHDKCNYNCSFCGDENKLGRMGWFDHETNKKIVDSIANSKTNKPLWVQLTGGEPTLYPKYLDLLKYMKEKGLLIKMISNASRTIRWWKELRDAKVVDNIAFTFHSEQKADYKHVAEVSNLFLEEETVTVIAVTYVASSLSYALEGTEYLIENTGSYVSMNAMDFDSFRIDETMVSEEQFNKILNDYNLAYGKLMNVKKKSPIPREWYPVATTNVTYNDGSTQNKDVTQMMKLGENRFKGWLCEAGMDTMHIDGNKKFRGGCRRDATTFEPDKLTFFDKPFICDVADCYCAMDMITTKIKISE